MTGPGTEQLEHQLVRDLGELRDDLREDAFARELYRGLASHELTRLGNAGSGLSLSWRRAEDVINELRERAGSAPLALAETGGEGELSDRVAATLADLGWRATPLDTSHHQPGHVSEPPPPKGEGKREAPRESPDERGRAPAESDG